MTNQPLQVTPADQWGVETVQFPSGNVAKLRRPSVVRLAIEVNGNSDIPDYLQSVVVAGIKNEKPPEFTAEMLPNMLATLDKLCVAAFVEPQVSLEEEPGRVAVKHIADMDKFWLFSWVQGMDGTAAIRFPQQSVGNMAAVSGQQNGGNPAQPTYRSRKR